MPPKSKGNFLKKTGEKSAAIHSQDGKYLERKDLMACEESCKDTRT